MEINKRVYRGRSRGHLPRGVRKCRAGYRAEVSVGGVLHHLGVYSTQGEAAASYWREKGRIQQTGRGIREVAIIRAAHNDNIVPVQKELPLDSGGPKRGNAKWSVLEIRQVLELISQGTSIADIAVIIERTEGAVLQRYVKLVQAGEGTFEKHKLPVLTPARKRLPLHHKKDLLSKLPGGTSLGKDGGTSYGMETLGFRPWTPS